MQNIIMVKIKQETYISEIISSPSSPASSPEPLDPHQNEPDDDVHRFILPGPGRCTKRLLHISDSFLSLFLITPMVVSHWNGTWALIDIHPEHFTPLNSFLFGCMLHICFVLIKDLLHKSFSTPSSNGNNKTLSKRISRFIAMKTYTYLFSWGCNMHWCGCWSLFDRIIGKELWSAILQIVICSVMLTFLKSLRNLSAPPTFVLIDSKYMACSFPTRFRVKGSREPGLYVLDCIFSVLIVGTLVVVAWRGVWVMFDLTLYPSNKGFSAWGSLIIGYGIVAITFALQPIMRWTCDRLTGFWRIAVADIFLFLSFIGTVNVWRGVWMLLDVYLLPEKHVLSCWLTHSISFLILALLNCSNSVLVRGVYIDAEEPDGECVIFPIHYIRLFFQKERTKKQKRLLDALERQDHQNLLQDKQLLTHNNIKIIPNKNCNRNNNTTKTTTTTTSQITTTTTKNHLIKDGGDMKITTPTSTITPLLSAHVQQQQQPQSLPPLSAATTTSNFILKNNSNGFDNHSIHN